MQVKQVVINPSSSTLE